MTVNVRNTKVTLNFYANIEVNREFNYNDYLANIKLSELETARQAKLIGINRHLSVKLTDTSAPNGNVTGDELLSGDSSSTSDNERESPRASTSDHNTKSATFGNSNGTGTSNFNESTKSHLPNDTTYHIPVRSGGKTDHVKSTDGDNYVLFGRKES